MMILRTSKVSMKEVLIVSVYLATRVTPALIVTRVVFSSIIILVWLSLIDDALFDKAKK